MQNENQNQELCPFWGYLFIKEKTDFELWLHWSRMKYIKQEAPAEL
jgi:hypothetical protein